ncbi:MAG: hypothetical protein N2643_05320 [Endomicrobia bacterium]|nr:hypothetical protein [Endomicrobiia bacterium]
MFFKKFFKVTVFFIAGIIGINVLFLIAQEIYYLPYTIQIIQLKKWKTKFETYLKEEQKRVKSALSELETLNKKIKSYARRISLGEYHLIDKYNGLVNQYYFIANNYQGLFESHKKHTYLFEQNSKKLKQLIENYGKRKFLMFTPYKFKYEIKKGDTTYKIAKGDTK